MAIIFDPNEMLKKAAPKSKLKKMVKENFSLKRAIIGTLGTSDFPLNKKSIQTVALKALKSYKDRVKKETDKADKSELKSELASDPKFFINRVQNEIVYQVHEGIKERYAGEKARWLPSDADDPRPEHALYYGKTYIIGEGIDGIEPGDEPGCRCGVEILTKDTELDL
jgi:hypothetical protein